MRNAPELDDIQIRILVIQVIDPRVLHDEHESYFCGQKKFPTIDNHIPRYFRISWAETVARIRISRKASNHERNPTLSRKRSRRKNASSCSQQPTRCFFEYIAFSLTASYKYIVVMVSINRSHTFPSKLKHCSIFREKRTCWQHWRKERLNTSGTNDDWQHAYT